MFFNLSKQYCGLARIDNAQRFVHEQTPATPHQYFKEPGNETYPEEVTTQI